MPTMKIEAEAEAEETSTISSLNSPLALAAFEIGVSKEDLTAYLNWLDFGASTGVEWFEPALYEVV